jgi:hypothetical protein
MSGMKAVVRNVAVALGMACIVLIAGIGGAMACFTMQMGSKDYQTASPTEVGNQLSATIANQDETAAFLNVNISELIDGWNYIQTFSQLIHLNHLMLFWFNEIRTFLNQGQTPAMAQGSALGIQLTITLQKTVFRLGEPINVTLTMTNITNQTQTFVLGAYNDFDFHVYNETNSDIYWHSSIWLGEVAIPDGLTGITLNSTEPWGNSWTESFLWQQSMISGTFDNTSYVTVSPGTYYVVGRVGAPYFIDGNSIWQTTPIQITILPTLPF